MYAKLTLPARGRYRDVLDFGTLGMLLLGIAVYLQLFVQGSMVYADNFTDVFYTNSFRGSFEWFSKLDWIGMVVQAVISVFSLVGTSLIIIRVMTSMLYLSAKGLWEEVHDLKQSGGESEMYDFGLLNMAKSWAKGKAGTGLDAIFGAILVLLPDVKRYSDFGEKSGMKFEEDTTVGQYMLKVSIPVVLSVFFLAMGFNGTLVQGLAVTVDAMGVVADKAVSVNYAGFIEDIVNAGSGYKFTFAADGTAKGELMEGLAKTIYGRAVAAIDDPTPAQLSAIGQNVENIVKENFANWVSSSTQISTEIHDKVNTGAAADIDFDALREVDRYFDYLGYEVIVNTSTSSSGNSITLSDILAGGAGEGSADGAGEGPLADLIATLGDEDGASQNSTFHIYIKQTKSVGGNTLYFNADNRG